MKSSGALARAFIRKLNRTKKLAGRCASIDLLLREKWWATLESNQA